MILSHSKRFIFIHVYKSAGTSVREELERYNSLFWQRIRLYRYLGDRFPSIVRNPFPRHVHAREVRDRLPREVFDSYFKFAFVRNPWDWHVSQFHYILKKKTHHQHELFRLRRFEDYMEYLKQSRRIVTQTTMLSDENGRLLVDYVGKLENVAQDFRTVCERIQIPPVDLPHANRSERGPYQHYYNEENRRFIEDAYAEDIRNFGYSFHPDLQAGACESGNFRIAHSA